MVADTITLVMELDDKQFTVKMNNATRQIRQLSGTTDRTSESVLRMERRMGGLLPKLRDLTVTASMLSGGFRTLIDVTFGWQKSIIDASAEVEKLKVLLSGMSTQITKEGAAKELAHNFDFLMDTLKKVPFSLKEVSGSFVKFKSVGIDPTKGAFLGLADAVSNFGGNDETFHRATVAIQQMSGKGVISMEELRQQLGEAVPTAMKLLARATGQTMGDMVERISKGQMEASSAIKRLMAQFELTMGGSSERLMKTWGGMIRRMGVSWTLLKVRIGDTGFFDEAKKAVSEMTDAIDQGKFDSAGLSIGDALATFTKSMINLGKLVAENIDMIMRVGKALALAFAGGVALKALGALTLGAWCLVTSLRAVASGAAFAGLTLSAALGPIALIGAALIGLASYFWDSAHAAEEASDRIIKSMGLAANKANIDLNKEGLDEAALAIEKINERIEEYRDNIQQINNDEFNFMKNIEEEQSEEEKVRAREIRSRESLIVLQKLIKDKEELERKHTNFELAEELVRKVQFDRFVNDSVKIQSIAANKQYDITQKLYVQQARALGEKLEKEGLSQKEYFKQSAQLVKNRARADAAIAEQLVEKAEKRLDDMRSSRIKATQDDVNKQEAILNKLQAKSLQRSQNYIKLASLQNASDDVQDNSAIDNANKAFSTYMNGVIEKTAEARSGLKGLSKGVAELQSKLGAKFANAGLNSSEIAEAERKILVMEKEQAALKAFNKQRQDLIGINKALKDSERDLAVDVSALSREMELGFKTGSAMENGVIANIAALKEMGLTASQVTAPGIKKATEATEKHLEKLKEYQLRLEAYDMRKSNRKGAINLMTDRDQITARFEHERELTIKSLMLHQGSSDAQVAMREALIRKLNLLDAQYARDAETPIQQLVRSWQNATSRMEDASASWIDSFSNKLTDALVDGKASFSDFATSVVKDIIRIKLQKQIAGLASFDFFGGGAGAAASAMGTSVTGTSWIPSFAKGGIMSNQGQVPLNAYANGGIANAPQLALFGEGRMNEAYVPLPDGKTIPVTMKGQQSGGNVQVNVINQTDTEVQAEESQPRFDGKQMILDVVLTAVARPGQFRDGMKGAMS